MECSTIQGFPNERDHLFAQPWYRDGLTAEETASIVPLPSTIQNAPQQRILAPGLYSSLVESNFVQRKTVTLPLAGQVNIWVFQNTPFSTGDDMPSGDRRGRPVR